MKTETYETPSVELRNVLTENGFAASGGAGYSDTEGTENMGHSSYMEL